MNHRRAVALWLTLLALGVAAGEPTAVQDAEVLLTTATSADSSGVPSVPAGAPSTPAEDSRTEVSSSSPSAPLSSPASVDEPALSTASPPSSSVGSLAPSEAPLMASSTIVSSGQTASGRIVPGEQEATTTEASDPPKPLESGSVSVSPISTGTPEAFDGVGDEKKPAELEPESETPVISFGIRSFTVEVATGTERASTGEETPVVMAVDLSNATQSVENFTHDGAVSTVLPGVAVADTSEAAVQERNTPEDDGAHGGLSTVTINTQVLAGVGAPGGGETLDLSEDTPEDAFSNEIHVERNLKNGLYRIKIAEITTDEFDNGLRENDNENMLLTDTLGVPGQRQPPLHKSVYPSKINMDDFYPSKLEDFKQEQQQVVGIAVQELVEEEQEEKRLREKAILRNGDGGDGGDAEEQGAEKLLFESTIMKPSDMLPLLPLATTTEVLGEGMERPTNGVGTMTSISSPVSPPANATGPDGGDISTTKIEIELIDDTSETSASDERGGSGSGSSSSSSKPTIDNITEKLEENDEVISRIEENFKGFRAFEVATAADGQAEDEMEYRDAGVEGRKDDEVITIAISSVTFSSSQQDVQDAQTQTQPPLPPSSSSVAAMTEPQEQEADGVPVVSGSDIVTGGFGGTLFIPRRVKKNDPSTVAKLAQLAAKVADQSSGPIKKIDFAATKFNTDNSSPVGNGHDLADGSKKDKPEFSTTKFYNSKELYSELHHQLPPPAQQAAAVSGPNRTTIVDVRTQATATTKSKATAAVLSEKDIITAKTMSKPAQAILAASSRKPTRTQPAPSSPDLRQHTLKTNFVLHEETASKPTKAAPSVVEDPQQRKIKSLGSAASAIIAATAKLAKPSRTPASTTTSTTATSSSTTTTSTTTQTAQRASVASGLRALGASSRENFITKPTAPLSRLHEKINTLDCEMQAIAPESSVWRGNETHELQLPAMTPEDCSAGSSCTPTTISWEGTADIQSGDVLIVEIDDQHLIPSNYNKSSEGAHHTTTAVYQVTRLGHENCDITEGVLLDITPLVADGKKLVTLYDKDLTEGINLLIVVSEQWGQQCVRLKVTVKSDNCGENADCSGKGVCYSNISMEGYECQCCSGFAGTHCEEIDACSPSPCTNNGICVDLSQGHEGNAYQCLCPYGYTGKNCQFESDPCNPSQCLNGGTCVGNSTHFRCDCTSGYTGPLCQHNLNECESSPCVHGICVDQEDGFRCFCQPGFSGELCNFEYNECESNPCINGGQCIDNIGGFSCKCTRGYTGKRCHIKVDFCANDPCPDGHRCIDHGDDFTCECPGGRNGPDCNQVPRTVSTPVMRAS
uniref:EGF-like domain-containing protein n=1 Tax=Anopheles atroparvus TaxID=41427 RepID=A0A182JJ99_ANOAO